jgi:5-methylcytosine-specific restriction enzyme A
MGDTGGKQTVNRLRELGFTEFTSDGDQADAYVEGERQSRGTTFFARNAQLVREAKAHHGTFCQTCGFDFGAVYGSLGVGYIECHHLKPSAEQDGNAQEVTVSDVAVLCSNCHRMIHRRRPVISVEKFKRAIIETAKRA